MYSLNISNNVFSSAFFFQLPPTIIRILLNHYKWDKEKLLEKYFDGNTEEFFKGAHVINPFNKSTNPSRLKVCASDTSFINHLNLLTLSPTAVQKSSRGM